MNIIKAYKVEITGACPKVTSQKKKYSTYKQWPRRKPQSVKRQNRIGFHIDYLPVQEELQCFPGSLGKIILSNCLLQSNHTTIQIPRQFHFLVFALKIFSVVAVSLTMYFLMYYHTYCNNLHTNTNIFQDGWFLHEGL